MLYNPPRSRPTMPLDPTTELERELPRVLDALQATCRPESLQRGRTYEQQGRVQGIQLDDDLARAEVLGTDDAVYGVTLAFHGPVRSTCTCPSFGSWDDHCKHVAALAFALERSTKGNRPSRIEPEAPAAPALVPAPGAPASVAALDELRDWLGLPLQPHAFVYDLSLEPGLAIGVARAERAGARSPRFVPIASYLGGRTLEPLDRRVFSVLSTGVRDPEGRYRIFPANAGALFEGLRSRSVMMGLRRITASEHPAYLYAELSQTDEERRVTVRVRLADGTLVALEKIHLLSESPVYLLHDAILHRLESGASLSQLEAWRHQPTLKLAREEAGSLDFALGGLRQLGVILDAAAEAAPLPPQFLLTLDGDAQEMTARLAVRYGDVELPLTSAGASTHVTADGRLIRRDPAAEGQAIEALLSAHLARGGAGTFVARADMAVEFWTAGFSTLPKDWHLFGPRPQQVVKLRRLQARVALTQARTGWFNLEVAFAEDDQSIDLAKLRPLLASGRRYAQMPDGSVGEIPREISEQLKGLLEETGAEPKKGAVELAPYEAGEVERLLELVPDAQVAPDARRFLAALRDFQGIEEVETPSGLKADLRPYQQRGLDWLMFLHRSSMSGVLADDMGLGKTVQALTLLLRIKKDEGKMPSLVVAPTSVLPNWQREAERFAPSLKVVVHEGADREKRRGTFAQADLVLTSYALLRRDVESLRKTRFRYLILDEAQHVKNPASMGAKAARSLEAEHRLALTGTPLENRLADLWSLFHFLMPGFLGSETDFRNRYGRPIEVDGNAGVRDRLRRRVHPFMLRRLKDEVARDLPPRTDAILPVELSAGQQALYREMLLTAQGRVNTIIEKMGFAKARISILTELLRLRQVCNDPRLLKLPPGTRLPPSAKLDAFTELVRDIIGEGHRLLVFSQFTEMLGHLVEWAQEEGVRYEYLDGETKDRQDRIDRFNAKDGPPIFFLSLKAGGTGLNLTAADYVIHFDPWWNPAVEQQAVDRVHRIGQTKPVFSYKLITKGTVEEKMLAMQDRKRALATGVLSSDDALGKTLTEKDVRDLFS